MESRARARYWCFTEWEEPDQLRHALIDEGLPQGITYLCGQLEIAPTTNRLHYQGYVELEVRQRITWLKKNLSPTAHFEKRFGDQDQAIHYTQKPVDGCDCKVCTDERATPTKVPMTWNEWGEPTDEKKGKRNDLLDVKAMIDDGEPEEAIMDQHFTTWCRNYKAFDEYRRRKVKDRDGSDIEVIVYYGEPRCGKSRLVRELYPNAYDKPVGDDWFDGYLGEETITFDEYHGGWLPWGVLLRITDSQKCTLRVKGSHVRISARRIVFTTNIHPKNWYHNVSNYSALIGRITQFYWCTRAMNDPATTAYRDFQFELLPPPFDTPPEHWNQPTNQIQNYRWN